MRRRQRALVVDQDPVARLAIDRQLETLGWDAVTVNNGSEALSEVSLMGEFFERDPPPSNKRYSVANRPLKPVDVGPNALEDERPLISAPRMKVDWIGRARIFER